jgi:methionyl-tRNA formyltransferase
MEKISAKIAFAGCKNTTLECMRQFWEDGFPIDYLITIKPDLGKKHLVSGYIDLTSFAMKNKISIYYANTYSMLNETDEQVINKLKIDLLFVIGWQRLIPKWLLDTLSIGAFGMHGSSEPLPKGRGRSPLNWSLIEDKKRFITNLFKYNEDVDAGEIVGSIEFDINPYDTCETLHFKNRIAMNRLLKIYLPKLLDGSVKLIKQGNGEPTYYPKRNPEDGIINWKNKTGDIYNLIRAVTRPFPGAFSFINKQQVLIWKSQPFDEKIRYDESIPGEILEVFMNGNFLVKTGDSTILITDYNCPTGLIIKGYEFERIT